MTAMKFTGLSYDSEHPELLDLIGLEDFNDDGLVSSAESKGFVDSTESKRGANRGFEEFFATLSPSEKALLNSFDATRPLRIEHFRDNPDLARVSLKHIVFEAERENITLPGFPTIEELDRRLDFSLEDVERPFIDAVLVDWDSLSRAQWDELNAGGTDPGADPLLAVLKRFAERRDGVSLESGARRVTFEEWQSACETMSSEGMPVDAWETWGRLSSAWLGGLSLLDGPLMHAPWHLLWILAGSQLGEKTDAYWGIGTTADSGGERLPLIGSNAVTFYLSHPEAFAKAGQFVSSYDAGLRSLRFEAKAVWPEEPTSVTLWEWIPGVSGARLYAAPGASVTAWQRVEKGEIKFLPGQPLVKLSGFQFQAFEESERAAEIHEGIWREFVKEYPILGYDIRTGTFLDELPLPARTDFDLEGFFPTGIALLNGRLCFTFTGESNADDFIKPLSDDVYAIDVSRPLTKLLEKSPYGSLISAFFDADGNVRQDVPLDVLQEAIQDALNNPGGQGGNKSWPSPESFLPAADRVVNEVRVDDVEFDLSPFILDADRLFAKYGVDAAVTSFRVADGRMRAQYRYDPTFAQASGDWFVEGVADLELGLSASNVSSGNGELFVGKLYFHYDALVNRGYAKLVLPEVALQGVGAQADGVYDGSVTVGIEFEGGIPGPGGYSFESLIKKIAVDAVLSVQKNHGDFFAAAVKIREERENDENMSVRRLMVDNNIALYDGRTGLYGILNNGTFSQIQARGEDNLYILNEFDVLASHAVVGGLGNFFGDGVAVEVRLGGDGSYVLSPKLRAGNLENKYEIEMGGVGGELVVTPVRNEGGAVDHFRVEARELSISISDAALDIGDKHVRGRMDAVLNGTWESEAPNLVELLANGRDWRGRGTIKMTRTDSNLEVTDDDGQRFEFGTDRIDTEFSIGAIEFNPLKGRGRLKETVKRGEIVYENRKFSLSTDISGSVTVSGKYPLVRMEVLQLIADGAQNQAPAGSFPDGGKAAVPETPPRSEIPPDVEVSAEAEISPEELIRQAVAPVRDDLHESSLLAVDPVFFVSEEFPLEAMLASLDDVTVGLTSLPVASGLDYEEAVIGERNWARYPLLKRGLLRFINPYVEEGTAFSAAEPQRIFAGGKMQPFRFDLNQYVSFLGIHFRGFGAEVKPCRHGSDSLHFYAYTKNGKIDLIAFLRLLFPFKIGKVYAALKKQGIDVGRGGVPEDRGDFVKFLREIEKVFRVEEGVREAVEARRAAFTPKEFKKFDRSELGHVWEKILDDGPEREAPDAYDGAALAAYLNGIAASRGFEKHFLGHLEVFDPKTRGQAYIYLEEIQRLRQQRRGEALTRAEKSEIRGYRHLILRMLLDQYLPNNDIVDFDNAVGFVKGYGTPQKADYEWFAFEENGTAPITVGLAFRDGRFAITAATEEGEAANAISLDILAPEFRIGGRVNSVSDLRLDIGPPAANGITAVNVSFGEYDVRDFSLVVMPKQPWDEPTFAILPPEGVSEGFNRAVGSGMTLSTQLDKRVSMDLNVREFLSMGSRLFISAPIYERRGEAAADAPDSPAPMVSDGGVIADYVDVPVNLDDASLSEITVSLRPLYDGTRPHQLNSVNLEGSVISEGGVNALVFIGRDGEGTRRYAQVSDVAAASRIEVKDQDVTLSGYARVAVTPPASLMDDPSFDSMREAGIGIRVDEAVFDGTFKIAVGGGGRGGQDPVSIDLTRFGEGDADFVPATLTVRGEFTFDFQGMKASLKEIRVPLDEFVAEIVAKDPAVSDSVTRAVVQSLRIPAGGLPAPEGTARVGSGAPAEFISAEVSGEVKIPRQFGIRDVKLEEATANVAFPGGAAFTTEDGNKPRFEASGGLKARIADPGERDVLDLSTGVISFVDGDGAVREWRLDANMRDLLYKTTVRAVLRGDARFETKAPESAGPPAATLPAELPPTE